MDERTCPWCSAVLTNPQRATCGAENCVRLQRNANSLAAYHRRKGGPERRICQREGCEREIVRAGKQQAWPAYCSPWCRNVAHSDKRLALKVDEPKPARPCDYCGKPLPEGAPSYRRFCDSICRERKAKGIIIPTGRKCLDCGKAIPDEAHPQRRYCDRSCKARADYRRNHVAIRGRIDTWKARNQAHSRAWHAAYREQHREHLSAMQRRDYRKDPLPWKNARDRRRALLAQGAGVVTSADWRKLVARFDGRCAYCGQRCTPTMEHVVPLSRGGRHAIGNLIPACLKCNLSKNNRFIMEWRLGRPAPRTRRVTA
jgi:hypothetical protein